MLTGSPRRDASRSRGRPARAERLAQQLEGSRLECTELPVRDLTLIYSGVLRYLEILQRLCHCYFPRNTVPTQQCFIEAACRDKHRGRLTVLREDFHAGHVVCWAQCLDGEKQHRITRSSARRRKALKGVHQAAFFWGAADSEPTPRYHGACRIVAGFYIVTKSSTLTSTC